MTEESKSQLDGFTCPHCNFKFSKWSVLRVTRWTRYKCPNCNSLLSPRLREVELTGVIVGILGAVGGYLVPFFMAPTYGLRGVLIGYLLYILFLGYVTAYVCRKYVHLELVSK
jgi:hypothetical protein